MGEPWIRVHANLAAKPVVVRAVEALSISHNEAIGLLVRFWGAVSQHVSDGLVGAHSDGQLEVWAGWTRKKGKFAAFVRAAHLDCDGRVNEWEEYAGALEEQRRQSRDRKRKSRSGHRDGHRDGHSDNAVTSSPTIRDDTKREIELHHLRHASAEEIECEAALAVMLDSDADRNALTVVVDRATDRHACLIALTSMLMGQDPATPQPSPAIFGQALRDLATNGERITARKFRNYLTDAARPAVSAPPSGAGAYAASGARRENTLVTDPDDTLTKWARDTDEREAKEQSHA